MKVEQNTFSGFLSHEISKYFLRSYFLLSFFLGLFFIALIYKIEDSFFNQNIASLTPVLIKDYVLSDYRSMLFNISKSGIFEPDYILICSPDQKLLIESMNDQYDKFALLKKNCSETGLSSIAINSNRGVTVFRIYAKKVSILNTVILNTLLFFVVVLMLFLFIKKKFFKQTDQMLRNELQAIVSNFDNSITGSKPANIHFSEFIDLNYKIAELLKIKNQMLAHEIEYKKSRMLAHDLQTPIAIFSGISSAIQSQAPKVAELFEQANNRLIQLVKSLVKIEVNTQDFVDVTPVDFSVFMKPIFLSFENIIKRHQGLFYCRCSENLLMSHQYALDLSRIVENLIKNSLESYSYSQSKKPVVIFECYAEKISSFKKKLILKIKDHGSGIDQNVIPLILKSGGHTTKKNGNGLGLSYAYEWVTTKGGVFDLQTALGEGTQITMEVEC